MFLDLFKDELPDKGIGLCKHKTEILTTSPNHLIPLTAFQEYKVNQSGNFKFLGAPFGSPDF